MSDLISRQAVINELRRDLQVPSGRGKELLNAAVEVLVTRIKELPATQPVINVTLDEEKVAKLVEYRKKIQERKNVPNDDLISRQEAIAYAISGRTREFDGDKWIRVSEVRESLKTMPSAQPEKAQLSREDTTSDCISRQAVIDVVERNAYWHTYIDQIVDIIKALPSVHPKFPENWWKTDHGYMWLCPHCGLPVHSDFEECLRCGIKRKSAQPEQKKGKWIHNPDPMAGEGYWRCSECGYDAYDCGKYCPNCGARMEGEL